MNPLLAAHLNSIVLGILSSLAASAVFLYIFFARLRPRIEISPYIAVQDEEGKKRYVFKIVNKTSRPVVNVRCRVAVVVPRSVPGGLVFRNETLRLKRDEVFYIDRYDRRDKDAQYAWRFACYDDIENGWDEGKGGYVVFRVIATDSLSGLSRVFAHRYYTKRDSLRVGAHKFGDHVEVE